MALSLGKLTIIVGAGVLGSVLAKEGRMPSVSDFFSGAFKIGLKQLKQDDSKTSTSKPRTDALMQQVNSLREELQLLASNRSITIVTGDRSGSGKYGVVVIVVVVGYGYVWWKGWKLTDMMFATRRGLNDACASVAKQLENVYASVSATKKHLSSRIDRVDCKIDECADNTAATKDEVNELRGDVKLIGADVQSVHHVVQSLESKISRIEGRQNEMNFGVGKLVGFVRNLESSRSMEHIEGAARPAIESSPVSPSRTVSLPATLLEPPSPSSSGSGSERKQASVSASSSSQSNTSGSGLKDLHGMPNDIGLSRLHTSPGLNSINTSSEETNIDNSSGAGLFGKRFSGFGASLLTRSRIK
ncbi:uncharacterized protein LOC127245628 [Andrographis paniculata]|uniref:uncharacterized protein LOC127245628 n=1 Tax=Andrographis paniculata TaxID=175694 RepID=UPI0021E98ED9|nr:uncharacterized protein LOC127245628 [Andrographis paniculata]